MDKTLKIGRNFKCLFLEFRGEEKVFCFVEGDYMFLRISDKEKQIEIFH